MLQRSSPLPIIVFLVISFGVVWTAIFTTFFSYENPTVKYMTLLVWIVVITPLVAMITVKTFFMEESKIPIGFRIGKSWYYFLSFALPALIIFCANGLTELLDLAEGDFSHPVIKVIGEDIDQPGVEKTVTFETALLLIFFVQPLKSIVRDFFLEMPWRGYFQQKLMHLDAAKAILITSLLWGLWNAPKSLVGIMYSDHPYTGIIATFFLSFFMGIVLGWLRYRSGSIFPAVIAHCVFSGAGLGFYIFFPGADPILAGFLGLPGIACLAITSLTIWLGGGFKPLAEEGYA